MSGIITMRILVKKDKISDFIQILTEKHISILETYDKEDAIEFITIPELMGYYEPDSLYDNIIDYVEDIWHLTINDIDLKVGRDKSDKDFKWYSCKRASKNV